MDKPKKLKMNAKTFRIITAPIMVLFLIFALALSIITNYFTPSLNACPPQRVGLPGLRCY